MLSDEERELIEEIQKGNKIGIYELIRTFKREGIENFITVRRKYIDIMINLIEKQSKEIEELKEKEKNLLIQLKDSGKELLEVCEKLRNSVSKDKIKEILGIEEDINNEKLLSLLQTIVDENARLEDIEDRKVQIEYNNVFNKGVKSVEDKIKAKIEEVDIQLQKLKDGLTGRKTNFVNKNMLFAQKKALQSLLEKE